MYSQCPECGTNNFLTVDQLRNSHAMVRCSHCSGIFDALNTLSETADDARIDPIHPQPFLDDKTSIPGSHPYWSGILVFSCFVFLLQIIYFEGFNFTQNTQLRPWLTKACEHLSSQLPAYKNTHDFSIIHGALTPSGDGQYQFKAVISNQAPFAQAHPRIKLTLLKLTGEVFAQRIFNPSEYSPEKSTLIASNDTAEINISLAAPKIKIGGYTFELY